MLDLGAPVRVTWDLPADPALTRTLWERLCDGRVLFAEARVEAESVQGLAALSADVAAARGPRVTLTGDAAALAAALTALGAGAARAVELQLLPTFPTVPVAATLARGVRALTPSLWSTPEGLLGLADALELAAACGLPAVAVLNPAAPADPLSATDRARAAEQWRRFGFEGRVALRVHDLFLARALGQDPFRGYAGCQAGGYLAHLTSSGELVACRTLPAPLGDLSPSPLKELWGSPERAALRSLLRAAPAECRGCGVGAVCLGGCRGFGPELGRDRSCPGQIGA